MAAVRTSAKQNYLLDADPITYISALFENVCPYIDEVKFCKVFLDHVLRNSWVQTLEGLAQLFACPRRACAVDML